MDDKSNLPGLIFNKLSLLIFIIALSANAISETFKLGDLAPRGAPDGQLNAADTLLLQRILLEEISPTSDELLIGDVAPLGSPNKQINAGDLAVLQRAVLGLLSMGTVNTLPPAPVLDTAVTPTTENPYQITGYATPNTTVYIYVNGNQQHKIVSNPSDGKFSIYVYLFDGDNAIHATEFDGSDESDLSNIVQVVYNNEISRVQTGTVISTNTVWTPGLIPQAYTITSNLTVKAGVSFILQPGTTLLFKNGEELIVNGELRILGTSTNQVTLTSINEIDPAPGNWRGIKVNAGASNVVIDNASIEWSIFGVQMNGAINIKIINSTIRNTSSAGISVNSGTNNVTVDNVLIEYAYQGVIINSGSTNTSVMNSIIQNINQEGIYFFGANGIASGNNINNAQYGIFIRSESPLIENNNINNCSFGIYMYPGTPGYPIAPMIKGNAIINNNTGITISPGFSDVDPVIDSGNIITNNTVGLSIVGFSGTDSVHPRINNNEIHTNISANILSGTGPGTAIIDATGNWWGTTIVNDIAVSIYDHTDDPSQRVVDFKDFLDAANGKPVIGNYLPPIITQNMTLKTGTVYQAIGNVHVQSGAILTIEEGVEIQFASFVKLIIDGDLHVNATGSLSNPAIFTSINPLPGPGDWSGIKVNASSTNTFINGAIIEFSVTGVEVNEGVSAVSITNSLIKNNSDNGIRFNKADGVVRNNVISGHSGNSLSSGINITDASPQIGNNVIYSNSHGISIYGAQSSPIILNNNIYNNTYGIYLSGSGAQISGNIITANTRDGIRVLSSNVVINMGNIISNNTIGVYLGSGSVAQLDANAIVANAFGIYIGTYDLAITNNDIYDNTSANIFFGGGTSLVPLSISGNWWGTDVIADIRAKIIGLTLTAQNTMVLLDAIATAPNISAVVINSSLSEVYISPGASAGEKDFTLYSATLSSSANWNIEIYDVQKKLVKTFSGLDSNISVAWDGRDESSNLVVDGRYDIVLDVDGIMYISSLHVDNTLPLATIVNPTENQRLIDSILNIEGVVYDISYQKFQIDVADTLSPNEADYRALYTETTVYTSTGSLQSRSLYDWLYNDVNNLQQQGDKTLRLMVTDKAGNVAMHTVAIESNYLAFTSASLKTNKLDVSRGETVEVEFSISKPATVKLKIYQEFYHKGINATGEYDNGFVQSVELIAEQTVDFSTEGNKSISWDGRDLNGNYVPQDFYRYELEAISGETSNRYFKIPVLTRYSDTPSIIQTTDVSAVSYLKNQFVKLIVNVPVDKVVRIYFNMDATVLLPVLNKVVDEGDYIFPVAARNSEGKNIDSPFYIPSGRAAPVYQQSPDTVFVKNKTLEIIGTETEPNIEIKSDPYRIKHSYDQVTNIGFTVSEESYVTVEMLVPCPSSDDTCSTDPAVASVYKVMDNELLSANDNTASTIHSFSWRGYVFDTINADTNNIMVSADGLYTYFIKATSKATGNITTFRGSLYLNQ